MAMTADIRDIVEPQPRPGMATAAIELARTLKSGRFEILPPRRTFADPALHRAIMRRCDYPGGFFFEAGANDGLAWSNTAYLERHRGWTGVLVEPAPNLADACRRNRTGRTVQAALTSRDGGRIDLHYADLMSAVAAPGVDAAAHARVGQRFIRRGQPGVLRVPTRTIDSLLAEAALPRLDLFVLDIEQAEFEALDGMTLDRWRPRAMLIETRQPARLIERMAADGYHLAERLGAHDLLFVRPKH